MHKCVFGVRGRAGAPEEVVDTPADLREGGLALHLVGTKPAQLRHVELHADGRLLFGRVEDDRLLRPRLHLAADDATLWDFGLFLFEGALGPEVRRQMERVRPAGVEWSYSDDAASPQPAVVE